MAKIVIAEDDAHVIRLMAMWLTRSGHEVFEARNGNEAKEHLQENEIDLLVTDVNMPHCDGIELIQWLRNERKSNIPVITLSARCDQAKLGENLSSLNVTVHPKPFSPSRLNAEIQEKLAAAHTQ